MNNDPITSQPSRRRFVKGALIGAAGAVALRGSKASEINADKKPVWHPEEWRNKQEGMAYRRLGRTGFMISEMVMGGSGPLNKPDTVHLHEEAIERGVNYLDSASRYHRGQSEEAWGTLLAKPGVRDKVFVATKLSNYNRVVDRLVDEIFSGLPGEKQEAIRKRAREMVEDRQVTKLGYFFPFFRGHARGIEGAYEKYLVKKEYGFLSKWKPILEKELRAVLEQSLRRLKTDTIDVLHFPHGVRMPEELEDEFHKIFAEKLKKEGKIRFNAFSCHTDQPRVLSRAAELGHIDVAMVAYNIANQGSMEPAIEKAVKSGMGIIAMKAAAAINPIMEELKPAPDWRIQKLNHVIPGDMPIIPKAYLWALQNPNLSAVISEFPHSAGIKENLEVVGKKVKLNIA